MPNISKHTISPTIQAIYKHREDTQDSYHRSHLGASQIGHNCSRALWYGFRWVKKQHHAGQLLRLFETGQLAEDRFVAELKSIGCDVWEVDPDTGKQFNIKACGGHFGGSLDGVAIGILEAPHKPHVVEMKTHNDKSFKELVKFGVKKAKPMHYAQMQVYMRRMDIDRAFYMAVNKNTDELYGERVKLDVEYADRLIEKAQRIIFTDTPPQGVSENPSWYECKWCDYFDICHNGALSERNCRTCTHITAEKDGTWTCEKHKKTLSTSDQRLGCGDHRYNPNLIKSTPVEMTTSGTVVYENGYEDNGQC